MDKSDKTYTVRNEGNNPMPVTLENQRSRARAAVIAFAGRDNSLRVHKNNLCDTFGIGQYAENRMWFEFEALPPAVQTRIALVDFGCGYGVQHEYVYGETRERWRDQLVFGVYNLHFNPNIDISDQIG